MATPARLAEWVWAAVALASLGAIALSLRSSDRLEPPHDAALRPLFVDALDVDEVAVLEIRRDGEIAKRERGVGWSTDLRSRLRLLLNARLERVVDPSSAAAERFGLVRPSLGVRVYGPGPEQLVLELDVGDRAPDELSVYVEARPGPGISKLPAYQIDSLIEMLDGDTRD